MLKYCLYGQKSSATSNMIYTSSYTYPPRPHIEDVWNVLLLANTWFYLWENGDVYVVNDDIRRCAYIWIISRLFTQNCTYFILYYTLFINNLNLHKMVLIVAVFVNRSVISVTSSDGNYLIGINFCGYFFCEWRFGRILRLFIFTNSVFIKKMRLLIFANSKISDIYFCGFYIFYKNMRESDARKNVKFQIYIYI